MYVLVMSTDASHTPTIVTHWSAVARSSSQGSTAPGSDAPSTWSASTATPSSSRRASGVPAVVSTGRSVHPSAEGSTATTTVPPSVAAETRMWSASSAAGTQTLAPVTR